MQLDHSELDMLATTYSEAYPDEAERTDALNKSIVWWSSDTSRGAEFIGYIGEAQAADMVPPLVRDGI